MDQNDECPYVVCVGDNYHYMDEDSEHEEGRYRTWEEAVERCKGIVDDCLKHLHEPGMSAERLWRQYMMFGEDPFIVPNDGAGFSAWKYAKRRCAEICLLLVVSFPFSVAACAQQSADTERLQQTKLEQSAEPGVPPSPDEARDTRRGSGSGIEPERIVIPTNAQAQLGDVRIGAANFWERDYTDDRGVPQHGLTALLVVFVRRLDLPEGQTVERIIVWPGMTFQAGRERFRVESLEEAGVTLVRLPESG